MNLKLVNKPTTAQKMKFSIKDFFSKYVQIRRNFEFVHIYKRSAEEDKQKKYVLEHFLCPTVGNHLIIFQNSVLLCALENAEKKCGKKQLCMYHLCKIICTKMVGNAGTVPLFEVLLKSYKIKNEVYE